MKAFKDFGIVSEARAFVGDKIKIAKLLNTTIEVHAFKIENSKVNSRLCLYLQIEHKGEKKVVFTGSTVLIDQIQKVPEDGFPFRTIIVQEDERYSFT